MADTLLVLGQLFPADTAEANLYVADAATAVSSVVICNHSTATTYRVSVAIAGAVANDKQYLAYDRPIGANETHEITTGITLANTDVIRVRAGTGNFISFSAFGVKVT